MHESAYFSLPSARTEYLNILCLILSEIFPIKPSTKEDENETH